MKKVAVLVLAAFCISLVGCTTRLIDFTAISSKNCDIPGERGARVTGKHMIPMILGIPLGQPNIKEACDQAIEKGNGDCLVDGVLYSNFWTILVFGQMGYKIEGTVVNTKKK
ncbi:MAG: hypothetical protein JW983_02330 [Elusimicrobia bacterium]|nr:hypothetical protein [Elusimicrobiota bacterium]